MADLKIQPEEIRDMSEAEIRANIQEQGMMLIRDRAEGTVAGGDKSKHNEENTGFQKTVRHNIARLKTILNERENGGQ
jgi:ribosomal protein L29